MINIYIISELKKNIIYSLIMFSQQTKEKKSKKSLKYWNAFESVENEKN